MTDIQIQALREIDKWDKVGAEGVYQRLTDGLIDKSGAKIPGAGLHSIQAEAILAFIDGRFGTGIYGMRNWFDLIGGRFRMIAFLESQPSPDRPSMTKWDDLIEMPTCENNTWENGCRPKNIGWALDDIRRCAKAFLETASDLKEQT